MKKNIIVILLSFVVMALTFANGVKDSGIKGDEVAIPRRVVSLAPATTETIFALGEGDSLVARTDFCNWPKEVALVPSTGGFDGKSISLEKIVSFQPDLVCLAEGMHNHLIAPLENMGIQIFVSGGESISNVLQEITDLGKVLGKKEAAAELVLTIKEEIATAKKIALSNTGVAGNTVYWEIASSPYFSCGKYSFISDLLTNIGLKNIFSHIPQGYPQVSEESIIASKPDVIFFPDYMKEGEVAVKKIASRPSWNTIPAVVQGKVIPVDGDLFSRPGPRIGQMAIALAKMVQGK